MQLLENSREPVQSEYMLVVHSYFEQLTIKSTNENKTITPEVIQLHINFINITIIHVCLFHTFFGFSFLAAVGDYAEHC